MSFAEQFLGGLRPAMPMGVVALISIAVIMTVRSFLERRYQSKPDHRIRMQLLLLAMSFSAVVALIIVAPISDNEQAQIINLIGIVLSAAIALSATTFVGNVLAGLMLRAVGSFRTGDFVRVGDQFGRVSERGLFHVQIQTEESDLTTLPNLYLVTNPVKVVRSSGTILTAEVSLGYDVPHAKARSALLEAAGAAHLQEPFVQVMNLGDYSIVYRVAGLLTEVKQMLSARSKLREAVLDHLHGAGIEIVSPSFMNTRQVSPETRFVPKLVIPEEAQAEQAQPERIVFEKAEQAEQEEEAAAQDKSASEDPPDNQG